MGNSNPTPTDISFKRAFLISLVASLVLSALVAIVVFLIGNFGETEFRVIATTLTIGLYSLTGLCGSIMLERKKYPGLALIGILISVVGFLITLLAIWELVEFDDFWKIITILIILAVAIAHACLILLIESNKAVVRYSLFGTLVFISLVALMLIMLVLLEFDLADNDFAYRLLGVFAVLDVLGTIVTPILKKLNG